MARRPSRQIRFDPHPAYRVDRVRGLAGKVATTVLHVGGLNWTGEKAVVVGVLGREPGVGLVEANPVSQTDTVSFDTVQASLAGLRLGVEGCGCHSVGQSVPSYVCGRTAEPDPVDGRAAL